MTFIQIVSFRCHDLDALRDAEAEWLAATEGRRTLRTETVLVDRDDPTRFVTINAFDSYESAMENSALPETDAMAAKVGALLIGEPTYWNLDVVQTIDFSSD
jgi:quinol monooxygenase YgiN